MVVVSVTSWEKRIKILPKCLYYFIKNQTVKPDKIIITLSSDEFPNKEQDLPDDLLLLIDAFNIELSWVKKNIYAHKKYEVFKKYYNDYVIIIDDDIYYPNDYIEKLLEYSNLYPESVICYSSNMVTYDEIKHYDGFVSEPNIKTQLLSGLSCYPPHTFPLESYSFENVRDEISPFCDDSWINAWLIKTNTPICSIKDFKYNKFKVFKNSQEDSIWNTINSKKIKQRTIRELTFIKCLIKINAIYEAKKIWPEII